eukprot:4997146-Pleurochrysis_carterae.AAC.2
MRENCRGKHAHSKPIWKRLPCGGRESIPFEVGSRDFLHELSVISSVEAIDVLITFPEPLRQSTRIGRRGLQELQRKQCRQAAR